MVENWEILFYQKGWWGTSLYGGHILPPPDCNRLGLTNLPENDEDQSSPQVPINSSGPAHNIAIKTTKHFQFFAKQFLNGIFQFCFSVI